MIKAEEIVNKQFSRAFWGYDIGEVDEFLDDIVRSNERAEQELEIAQLRIKMLLEELEHYTGKRSEEAEEPEPAKAEPAPEKDKAEGAPESGGPEEAPAERPQAATGRAAEKTAPGIRIRHAVPEELDAIAAVEFACFPPAEAASRERIEARLHAFPKHFWVAEADGRVVGIINGMVCGRRTIVDEMFENAALHDEAGAWQSVMSIGVLPEYRGQGVAALLMQALIDDAKAAGRKGCTLTCKDRLIHYYAKFGYKDEGVSASEHGGAVWYDMVLEF